MLFSVFSSFATAPIWYDISSTVPADPEWQVVSQDADEIVIEFSLPGFYYEEAGGETFITIPSSFCPVDSGIPNTPVFGTKVGLPNAPDHVLDISILSENEIDTFLPLTPVPAKRLVAVNGTEEYQDFYYKNTTVYNTDKLYPLENAEVMHISGMREQNIASLQVNPVQYNPFTNKYVISSKIRITITSPNPTSPRYPDTGAFGLIFDQALLGYDGVLSSISNPDWPTNFTPEITLPGQNANYCQMLIIASDEFFETDQVTPCTALNDYINFRKNNNNYDIVVLNRDLIIGGSYAIRSEILNAYQNIPSRHGDGKLTHVLIIGSEYCVNESGLWAFSQPRDGDFSDCDSYYSKLVNQNGFGITFNPDSLRLDAPDVCLGRIPAANADELAIYYDKMVFTETSLLQQEASSKLTMLNTCGVEASNLALDVFTVTAVSELSNVDIKYLYNSDIDNRVDPDTRGPYFSPALYPNITTDLCDTDNGTIEPTPYDYINQNVFGGSAQADPSAIVWHASYGYEHGEGWQYYGWRAPGNTTNWEIDPDPMQNYFFPIVVTGARYGADFLEAGSNIPDLPSYVEQLLCCNDPSFNVRYQYYSGAGAIIGACQRNVITDASTNTLVQAFYNNYGSQAGELYLHSAVDITNHPRYPFANEMQVMGDPAFNPRSSFNLPDLAIEMIKEIQVNPDLTTSMQVEIHNLTGNNILNQFTVNIELEESVIGSRTFSNFPPFGRIVFNVDVNIPANSYGQRNFRAFVDVNNTINEVYESNNESSEYCYIFVTDASPTMTVHTNDFNSFAVGDAAPEFEGLELVSANACYNILTGEEIWKNGYGEMYDHFLPIIDDVDYDGNPELVHISQSDLTGHYTLQINDAATGTSSIPEYFITDNGMGISLYLISIDALSSDISPNYNGKEFIAVYNDYAMGTSGIKFLSINYDTGQWNEIWSRAMANSNISRAVLANPLGDGRTKVCLLVSPDSQQNFILKMVDLIDGSTLPDENFSFTQPSNNNDLEGLSVVNLDIDNCEELVFQAGEDIYRFDYNQGNGVFTNLTSTLGLTQNQVWYQPLAIGASANYNEVGIFTPVNNSNHLFKSLESNYTQMWSSSQNLNAEIFANTCLGIYDDLQVSSVFTLYKDYSGMSLGELIIETPQVNGTYTTDLKNILNPDDFAFLVDVNNDGTLEYVYHGGCRLNVLDCEVPGTAEWGYPYGDQYNTGRYGAYELSGNIPNNSIWTGNICIVGDITIPAGATLTIMPGTKVTVKDNVDVDVYGSLVIKGSDKDVTFEAESGTSGSWSGIQFHNGSNSDINGLIVKNAINNFSFDGSVTLSIDEFTLENASSRGMYFNSVSIGSDLDISNGQILNCGSHGVEIYNSGYKVTIDNVDINGCDRGVNVVNSNMVVSNCTITGNDFGMVFLNASKSEVNYSTIDQNNGHGIVLENSNPTFYRNRIRQNDGIGMMCVASSDAVLGKSTYDEGNSFYYNADPSPTAGDSKKSEIFISSSRPVFDKAHNDFVDTNSPYLIYDETYNGTQYGGKFNYFSGQTGMPPSQWFYPISCVDISAADPTPNHPEDAISSGPNDLEIALQLESNGDFINAGDLFFNVAFEDSVPAAFDGWIRCNMASGMTTDEVITMLDSYLSDPIFGTTAFWTRITIQNSNIDFVTSMNQLDEFITNAQSEEDSVMGLIGQLNTYYEMYLAGFTGGASLSSIDPGNSGKNKGKTVSTTDKKLQVINHTLSTKSLDQKSQKVIDGMFNLPQIGQMSEIVPLNISDYFAKKDQLIERLLDNSETTVREDVLPTSYELQSAYPNPFNPSIQIPFALPENSSVKLVVYNVMGQEVRTILNSEMKAGYHKVTWNGQNAAGNTVASGVYFVKMIAKDFVQSQKIVMIK